MLRKLGTFERALTLSDRHMPFNVVSVLRMENAPDPDRLGAALGMLQRRHPLLQARIRNYHFEILPEPKLDYEVWERQGGTQWLETVEQEMNTHLEVAAGLFRCVYLYGEARGDLVLTFHHAIMDASSGVDLLDELLKACAAPVERPPLEWVPPVEARFPPAFKGWRGAVAMLKYAASQMGDELSYWRHVRGKRVPPVRVGGRGFPATLVLPGNLVDALARHSRREGVTLNSLLNAALVLAVNRHLYEGRRTPMRTFTFADLRPYTTPPTPPEHLANYISMLRFTLDAAGGDDVWELAGRLHGQIYPALKRGDKFIASRMSESLMKIFLTLRSLRMGAVGLNYGGSVPLAAEYGRIKVTGLHGFLSSMDIGPEVSAQARLFNDELWFDLMFLDSDLDRKAAGELIEELRVVLEAASGRARPFQQDTGHG
jgi:hypothetical protein